MKPNEDSKHIDFFTSFLGPSQHQTTTESHPINPTELQSSPSSEQYREFKKQTLLVGAKRHLEASARKLTQHQPSLHLFSVDQNNQSNDQDSGCTTRLTAEFYPTKAYKCYF